MTPPEQTEFAVEPQYVDLEKAQFDLTMPSALEGDSKQDPPEELMTPDDAIPPPLDLEQLSRLSQVSGVRASIIDAVARNTVGLGYSLGAREGHEEEIENVDEEARKLRAALEALAARDKRLDNPTFSDLLYAVKTDEEECGWGFLEVSRNRETGQVDGIFHAPGKRMRRLKDRTGFVLLSATGATDQSQRFYNFGEKVEYEDDGTPRGKLKDGKDWKTNEVIVFRRYGSMSRDYGVTRDHALALEYLGDKKAAESNISFFDSSGTPPTVIFVQGEETKDGQGRVTFRVPQQTVERIANTLKSDSGHRHRVGIIPLPPGSKTTPVKLGEVSDRDVGFTDYRGDNRRRFLGAFRMAPIFIADLEDAGRYTAEVERALTLEQVFDPEQRRYEERLDETLLKDMGVKRLALTFKRLAVEDNASRRDAADKMAEVGTITNAEYRKAHGFDSLPEAKESETDFLWHDGNTYKSEPPRPGEVPHGWGERLIKAGQPAGAENRVVEGTGQQGLRPGTGARRRRQETAQGPGGAEAGAAAAAVGVQAAGRSASRRARERAGSNGGS